MLLIARQGTVTMDSCDLLEVVRGCLWMSQRPSSTRDTNRASLMALPMPDGGRLRS